MNIWNLILIFLLFLIIYILNYKLNNNSEPFDFVPNLPPSDLNTNFPDINLSEGTDELLPTYDEYSSQFYQQEVDLIRGAKKPKTPFEEISRENAINNINAQLLNNLLFRDVIMYENDLDPEGRLGLDKCLDNKSGYCVEYGHTGVAYYYPENVPYDYYGEIMNSELTPQEQQAPITGKISFPGLR